MWYQWQWCRPRRLGETSPESRHAIIVRTKPSVTPVPNRSAATGPEDLQGTARERLQKGLAPPRQIYEVQNRSKIDWATVPDWARPVDPEVFEGCTHEG
jgi:hypothetical protein